MPENTPVHSTGLSKESAARIAQAKTGLALVTGKPPKRGQYGGAKQR
jgi:hypothetical protein